MQCSPAFRKTTTTLLAAVAICTIAGFAPGSTVNAAGDADTAFTKLADDYLNDLPALSPVNATFIGDHRADDQLDQVDAAARSGRQQIYESYRRRLAEIDWQQLSRANQIDADLLRNEIDSNLWANETLQEWAWNPLVYVHGH